MAGKPLVHIFKSCAGNYYLYDTNKDKVVRISEVLYELLSGKVEPEHLDESNARYLRKLYEKGYLSDNQIAEIEHANTNDLEQILNRDLKQLTLQVTQACNLICSYCPYANTTIGKNARNHANKRMSWEVAKAAIDFYAERCISPNKAILAFYGGEPLIEFDLIAKCIEYCETLFAPKKVEFSLTTNGTLLTQERIDYLFSHKVHIMFSIDGIEKIHNIHRKYADGTGSFQAAYKNLVQAARTYDHLCSDYISINIVIDIKNDYDQIATFLDDCIFTEYDIPVNVTMAEYDYLGQQQEPATADYIEKSCYQFFLGALDSLKLVNGLSVLPFVKGYYQRLQTFYQELKSSECTCLPSKTAPGGPCIPGQKRLFVTVNGDFYPCERVSEVSSVTKIGSLTEGFDLIQAKNILNIAKITEDECKNCWAFRHCTACVKYANTVDSYSRELKLSQCESIKNDLEHQLQDCVLMKEIAERRES